VKSPNPPTTLTLWARGGRTLIVQEYESGGCEVWKVLAETIAIADTLKAIEEMSNA
jgi:hypothetical protein